MRFRRHSRREEPEINLIPLIDVMLVIVIFLMLTTSFSKFSGLEISLPTGESDEAETTVNEIAVTVTALGDVMVNQLPVGGQDIDAIAAALGKASPAGGSEPVVIINADAKAAHQRVVDVMQAAQRAGLPHITFAVQAPAQ